MIIITGATGQLGRAITEQLLKRVDSFRVGVSVRDPNKVTDFAARGVRVRAGDFASPESLRHSFENATQVLIVSSNAAMHGGDTLTQHRNAIEAACAAGAKRIVYTSHIAASESSAFPPMHHHATTEQMLGESGVPWTALRHGYYAESGLGFMGEWRETSVIAAPMDGKVSWTTHADLAEGAAAVLADEGRFDGPTPPLTGGESLDLADLAGLARDALGRSVRRQIITDDELRTKMSERGVPPHAANTLIGFYRASRTGGFAATGSTLQTLLGRAPTTMRELLAEKSAPEAAE